MSAVLPPTLRQSASGSRTRALLRLYAQFSTRRPATLPNSRSLFETRISFRPSAWAAISVSNGPMGLPARSSFARTLAYEVASLEVNSTIVRGRRKFSTRRSVFTGEELFTAARTQLGLADDADCDICATPRKHPLQDGRSLLEGVDAGIGIEQVFHSSFSRSSASPCGGLLKSSGTPQRTRRILRAIRMQAPERLHFPGAGRAR